MYTVEDQRGEDVKSLSQVRNELRSDSEALAGLIKAMRRRKAVLIASAVGGLLVAVALCLVMRPLYEATATLLIDKGDDSGIDLGSLSSLAAAAGGTDDLKTDLQTRTLVLKSDTTILAVEQALNLSSKPPFAPKLGWFARKRDLERPELPLEQNPERREKFLTQFKKSLVVKPMADSRLIQISVDNPDPSTAATIANALANTYIHNYLETRFKATAQASDWLSAQLDSLKKRVQDSQDRLSDYEKKTGLSVLMAGLSGKSSAGSESTGAGNLTALPAVERLSAINAEVTAAEANRIAKEAIYRLSQSDSPDVVLGIEDSSLASVGSGTAVLSSGGGLTLLHSLRQEEAGLKVQLADFKSKLGPENPRMLSMQSQVAALEEQIRLELQRIRERAKNDFLVASRTESELRAQFQQQQADVSSVNDKLTQLQVYAVEAVSSRDLYEGLYTKLQEASVTAGVHATNVSVIDVARAPASPIRPNWKLYPLVGVAAGLFIGVCLVVLLEMLNTAIITADDLAELSALPVLSAVARIKLKTEPGSDSSFLVTHPRAPESESYRILRTSILLSVAQRKIKTVLITSGLGSEGKTTTAYNLAVAFAQQNAKVLLIDADLRKPSIHVRLHLRQSPGLSNILTEDLPFIQGVIPHPSITNLSIMTSGPVPPMSSELLASEKFDQLLEWSREEYDMVIIDSPPLMLVTDAVVLSTKVDGTVMIVRSGTTPKAVARRMLETLARSSGRKLGFVLNGLDTRSVDYYYSYGYYGGERAYGDDVE